MRDRLPVPVRPVSLADHRLVDPLLEPCLDPLRDREPMQSLWGLDEIAVAPVPLRELAVVEQDELVNHVDQVEVALPGDVVGLDDRHPLRACAPRISGRTQLPGETPSLLVRGSVPFAGRPCPRRTEAGP